nr:sulfite exporter TauE/SafE family protein [Tianweitania sediminis]
MIAANATSAVTVFLEYLGGAAGFRGEIRALDPGMLLRATAAMAAGGLVGSLLLLVSSNEAFAAVVPFLLALATLVFAFGDRLRTLMEKHAAGAGATGAVGTMVIAVYGGYFNGGLGIMLLALFSQWGMRDLNRKNGLSFVVSAISMATFAAAGLVAWPQAVVMITAATIGGYLGAPVARALPAWMVRAGVIAGHRDERGVLLEARGMIGLTGFPRTQDHGTWLGGRVAFTRPSPLRSANAASLQVRARRSPILSTQPEPPSPWAASAYGLRGCLFLSPFRYSFFQRPIDRAAHERAGSWMGMLRTMGRSALVLGRSPRTRARIPLWAAAGRKVRVKEF